MADVARRRRLAGFFVVMWFASLLLPAMTQFFDGETPRTLFGWEVLLSGWIGAVYFQFGWYANLALGAVVAALVDWMRDTRWLKISGLLLLLTSLNTMDLFIRPEFNQMGSVHVGYFLWITNNVAAALAALFFSRRNMAET